MSVCASAVALLMVFSEPSIADCEYLRGYYGMPQSLNSVEMSINNSDVYRAAGIDSFWLELEELGSQDVQSSLPINTEKMFRYKVDGYWGLSLTSFQ